MRRWAAALVAALAGFVAVGALSPRAAGGPGVPTVVTVREVAAGQVVGSDDVEVVPRARGQRPSSALASVGDVVGRAAAGPIVPGEVVTPGRIAGSGVLAGQPSDHVAMSVPVLDVAAVGVRPGSRVDLYATGTGDLAAGDVVVLGVRDRVDSSGLGSTSPPQLTLALSPAAASAVARSLGALEAGQSFVVAIRHTASGSQ